MFPGFLVVMAKVFAVRTTAEAIVGLGVVAAGVTGTVTVGVLPEPVRDAVAEAAASVLPAVLPHDEYPTAPAPTVSAGDPTSSSGGAAPPRAGAESSSVGGPSPQATGQQATGQQATDLQAADQQPVPAHELRERLNLFDDAAPKPPATPGQ